MENIKHEDDLHCVIMEGDLEKHDVDNKTLEHLENIRPMVLKPFTPSTTSENICTVAYSQHMHPIQLCSSLRIQIN